MAERLPATRIYRPRPYHPLQFEVQLLIRGLFWDHRKGSPRKGPPRLDYYSLVSLGMGALFSGTRFDDRELSFKSRYSISRLTAEHSEAAQTHADYGASCGQRGAPMHD